MTNNILKTIMLWVFLFLVDITGTFSIGKNVFDYESGNPFRAMLLLLFQCTYLPISGIILGLYYKGRKSVSEGEKKVPNRAQDFWQNLRRVFLLAFVLSVLFLPARLLIINTITPELFVQQILVILPCIIFGVFIGITIRTFITSTPTRILFFLCSGVSLSLLSSVPIHIIDPMRYFTPMAWSIMSQAAIYGFGNDVARDECWSFPEDLRHAMTQDDKYYFECNCMGDNILLESSCSFPGIGSLITFDPSQPPLTLPPYPGEPPAPPIFPNAPQSPKIFRDSKAVNEYLENLKSHQEVVENLENEYELKLIAYQLDLQSYWIQAEIYDQTLSMRNSAIQSAEALIENTYRRYAWIFIGNRSERTTWISIGWTNLLIGIYSGVFLFVLMVREFMSEEIHS